MTVWVISEGWTGHDESVMAVAASKNSAEEYLMTLGYVAGPTLAHADNDEWYMPDESHRMPCIIREELVIP